MGLGLFIIAIQAAMSQGAGGGSDWIMNGGFWSDELHWDDEQFWED
jgi:hypothetical protein